MEGYEKYHDIDSKYSLEILKKFKIEMPSSTRAMDIGAGMGRTVRDVIHPAEFEEIDIVE